MKKSPSRLRRRAKHDALLGPTRRLVRVLGSVELLECGHTAPVLPTTTRSGTGQIFRRCMGCRDGAPSHADPDDMDHLQDRHDGLLLTPDEWERATTELGNDRVLDREALLAWVARNPTRWAAQAEKEEGTGC